MATGGDPDPTASVPPTEPSCVNDDNEDGNNTEDTKSPRKQSSGACSGLETDSNDEREKEEVEERKRKRKREEEEEIDEKREEEAVEMEEETSRFEFSYADEFNLLTERTCMTFLHYLCLYLYYYYYYYHSLEFKSAYENCMAVASKISPDSFRPDLSKRYQRASK